MKKKLLITILLSLSVVLLSSCSLLSMFDTEYRVLFYNDGELVSEVKVKEAQVIKDVPLIAKRGYNFVGWFQNLNDDVPFNLNQGITENLRLDAKWELDVNYIEITNLRLEDDLLIWDHIDETTYKVHMLDTIFEIEQNSFSLKNYKQGLSTTQTVKVEPVKMDHIPIIEEREVKFNDTEIITAYDLDFDMFDYSDFKELNRSTYKDSLIDHDDDFLDVKQGRLTAVDEFPKTGVVALILRENGSLELKEGYENFAGLKFNLGSYKDALSTSTVDVYIANNPNNFKLAKTFDIEGVNGFELKELTVADVEDIVNLKETVYLKFVVVKEGGKQTNIVLDDIFVYQFVKEHFTLSVETEEVTLSDYYKTAQGLKGKDLVDELRIIVSTNLNNVNYRDFKEIGEHADYKEDDKNVVIGIYDRKLLKANWGSRSEWHREHVWPNSRLGMGRVKETQVNQGSDPHNLRAIFPSTNSSRSNRYYDLKGEDNDFGHTLSGGRYYPGDLDKGDVSRILMYMVIRYEFLGLTDEEAFLSRPAYTPEAGFMGKLSILLDWHLDDPVDDFEVRRNNVIYSYQNNRNPFIDHPELFEEVYNYYMSIDANRALNIIKYFEFIVDITNIKQKEEVVVS